MPENPFAEGLKTYSNAALLYIIFSKENYQAPAVEAAAAELTLRNVSQKEIEEIKTAWLEEQKPATGNRVAGKLNLQLSRLLSPLNPFNRQGADRDIAMIIMSIGFFLFFNLTMGYEFLVLAIQKFFFRGPEMIQLLPFLLLPVGLYFFGKRKQLGWIVLCAWAVYSLVMLFPLFLEYFRGKEIFLFYQSASLGVLLTGVFIFGGIVYSLNRKAIRDALRISPLVQGLTIALSAGLTVIVWMLS
jgi:hypothetical protein